MRKLVLVLVVLIVGLLAFLYAAGIGTFAEEPTAGSPKARAAAPEVVAARDRAVEVAARGVGVARPKQIL